jgi:hypothetical protein
VSLTKTGTFVAVIAVVVVASSAASPERKVRAPKIVAAAMLDTDSDTRADGVRLTYSQRVKHVRDRDGKYPFAVIGYRVSSVGAANGKTLLLLLVEKANPDPDVRPAIRYRRTRLQPVRGASRTQAAAQMFRATRPHGQTPPPTPPANTEIDSDGDGTLDTLDCAPQNRDVHPNAPDRPDLSFVDSNCDGIDGTEKDAVFASPSGNDTNPGTKSRPKREVQAAVQAAAGKSKYVLAALGSYGRVTAASDVHVFGGYDRSSWQRSNIRNAQINGVPEGVFADGAKNVTLQLLTIRGAVSGAANGDNAYGIRAINGSSLTLQRVSVLAGDAAPGPPGADGAAGRPGSPGLPGRKGADDSDVNASGGEGGDSPAGRTGGRGGDGRYEAGGRPGQPGLIGTPGGTGGDLTHGQDPGDGADGGKGQNGTSGGVGRLGAGGGNSTALATTEWIGQGGAVGATGAPGNGGGGGGGGGGQTGYFVINGTGGGGGGGGGAGEGGGGGSGGGAGGGSFGVYLYNSSLVAQDSTIAAGKGGTGGRGGNGGPGGGGGAGGVHTDDYSFDRGIGGDGGRGGNGGLGGGGGGGAGGPSVGIFKAGTATARTTSTNVTFGAPGPGGASGPSTGIFANPFPAQPGVAAAVYP